MNELIRELAEQADIYFTVGGKAVTIHRQEIGTNDVTNGDLEKFAELIVRECADVCRAQRDPSNLNYKPTETFSQAIESHFGVKL